jgi:hypothetical protein
MCRGVQSDQGDRIKGHPVARESSPNDYRNIWPSASMRGLRHEPQKIDEGVYEEAVYHVTHPPRCILEDELLVILPVNSPRNLPTGKHNG